MIRSLEFDGYRAFPCRRRLRPEVPRQRLELAPLTLLLGRNSSGKTSVARLLLQVLGGLGEDDPNAAALPLGAGGREWAQSFQDLLPARDATGFLDLAVEWAPRAEMGKSHRLETGLYLPGAFETDPRPHMDHFRWDARESTNPPGPKLRGLLPEGAEWDAIRHEARAIARRCYLGPAVRDEVEETYRPGGAPPDATRPPREGRSITEFLGERPDVFEAASQWLQTHAGCGLRWERNLDLWRLMSSRGGIRVPFGQVGAGLHQLLPILALALWRAEGNAAGPYVDLIQQPELHLHDALHPALGDLFLAASRPGTGVALVETHSEGLLLRIRRRVAEGTANPDQIALYFIDDAPDGNVLRRIALDDAGEVDWWPEGVFLEAFAEVKALRAAQRTRQKAG